MEELEIAVNRAVYYQPCHPERSEAESKDPFSFLRLECGSFGFVTQILANLLHFAQDDSLGGSFKLPDKLKFEGGQI